MAAAIKLELDKLDFSSQGRRLQEGESMAKPVKSVQAEAAATTTCGERCDNFDVTVTAYGPALQAISEEVRKLNFLKSVANTLRSTEGDGRAKVDLRVATATYTPIQVEGADANWVNGSPVADPNFVYEPTITRDAEPTDMTSPSPSPPPPTGAASTGSVGVFESESAQSVDDDAKHPGAIFAYILVCLLVLCPVSCYYYARTRYGEDRVGLWFRYKCSHSNPTLPFFYKPREEMESLRQQLEAPRTSSKMSLGETTLTRGMSQTAV